MYTGHIYQFFTLNQEPMVRMHIEDILAKGQVSLSNLADGGEDILERRKGMSKAVCHMIDQVDYLQAMSEVFKGLRRFTQACQLCGVIPKLPYEDEERLVYE